MDKVERVRIIVRYGTSDGNGNLVGYRYETVVVPISLKQCNECDQPEIIGGEWLG